jgi:ubiquitin-activating enzyme E1
MQFFLREADVGKPRAQVTAPRLAELNSYVPVKILEGSGEITADMVAPYQVSYRLVFESASSL